VGKKGSNNLPLEHEELGILKGKKHALMTAHLLYILAHILADLLRRFSLIKLS